MTLKAVLPVLLLSLPGAAQVQSARPPFIRATGHASVSAQPDTAKVGLGIVTQAQSAQAAASQNASQTSAVNAALQSLLGANADIKTLNYSISPNYAPSNGGPPTLTGYTVTNSVEVTLSDVTSVGKVIDTAVGAGANSVQQLNFTLKDDSSVRQQALRLASQQAMSDANAIASGLNVRLGAVLSAVEGTTSTPVPLYAAVSAVAPTTPIQPGSLTIQATVTLDVQISQ